uniref:NADH-ubiquinone oxidoreductase chain 4L n=1 Tax=Dicranocentrus wangi TaxID=1302322 RepID=A0A6H0EVU6_9HEXA|nr:NADH dehydrogenase subunit 4L [Dicranocentrus wangi]QIT06441.1 NADH dehydrogenase subunit 4L [Dicranocentrus wangi]
MSLLVLVSLLGVFCGFLVFCSTREHLLSVLLSLEFMVICIFFLFLLSFFYGGGYYSLIYLIMAACEGALGLSVLVVMGRTHGGDYFKCFNVFE